MTQPKVDIHNLLDKDRLTAPEVRTLLNISKNTLYRYSRDGKIRRWQLSRSKYLYSAEDVYGLIGKRYERNKWTVVYARVKNRHHIEELRNQINRVSQFCVKNGMVVDNTYTDMCSAMDFSRYKRKGLHELIRDIIQKRVDVVVVESPDRITRYGHELLVAMCRYFKTKIMYLNQNPINIQYKDEIAEEMTKLMNDLKNMSDESTVFLKKPH